MGTKLFGVDIEKEIHRAVSPGIPRSQLLKQSSGARDATDVTAGLPIAYKRYACRAIELGIDARDQGAATEVFERTLLITAGSLPRGIVPAPGDRIKYLGETVEIVGNGVKFDPARAAYKCYCRG